MRILILALLIVLLPLRGWVGDAMAMDAARPSAASAPDAPAASPTAVAHCHEMPTQAVDGARCAATPCDAQADHDHCTAACQICHIMAMAPLLLSAPSAQPAAAPPAAPGARFASTEPAPGFKPPIS